MSRKSWFYREENIPRLWRWGAWVLGISVVAELFAHVHGHFWYDGWFGFNAVFGFVSCLAMVVFAKQLGRFVKRPDTFYDPPEAASAARHPESVRANPGGEH